MKHPRKPRLAAAGALVLCLLCAGPALSQPAPLPEGYTLENPITPAYLRKNLRRDRPRLIMTPETVRMLREKTQSDPVVRNVYQAVRRNAEQVRAKPLLERKLTGRRLLGVSRDMLHRMNVLGAVYLLEKDRAALERINDELLAVAAFQDWNPAHFLDVAEMSMAVALAVDWVGRDLPPATLQQAKQALIAKGLRPSFPPTGDPGWATTNNNWNQVCHGGMIAAAIAVADDEPELAARTIRRALDGLPYAMKEYGPDGVYPEGPTYWGYGTAFTVLTASMLQSALGSDFGLAASPGFLESADFLMMSTAPSGGYFNFADSGDRRGDAGDFTLAWFAAETGNRTYFERERFLSPPEEMGTLARHAGAGLVWLAQFAERAEKNPPLAWKGEGHNPIVVFRGGPDDPRRYYFAGKGGRGSTNHGNMDAGSFVFEIDGVRWSLDPGNQSYNELESAGFDLWGRCQQCRRWTLLTKNNYGHSTLTVNDSLHRVDGFAPLARFDAGPQPTASFDLTPVFEGGLAGARRTFTKESDRSLLIEDTLTLSDASRSVTWQMMTTAEVIPTANGAVLRQDGRELRLEILAPAGVAVSVVSLDPPPLALDRRIERLKRLEIRIPAWHLKASDPAIRVRLAAP